MLCPLRALKNWQALRQTEKHAFPLSTRSTSGVRGLGRLAVRPSSSYSTGSPNSNARSYFTGGEPPIEIEEGLRLAAKKSLDRMLEMASGKMGKGDLGPIG